MAKYRSPDLLYDWYVVPHKCGHEKLISVGHLLTEAEYRRIAAETRRELCPTCQAAQEQEAENARR